MHLFRMGYDYDSLEFLTRAHMDLGEEGLLEDHVRLDQVIQNKGDRLWYDYDFGDGWTHLLRVEEVLDSRPDSPRCLTGRRACPPEDCGGIYGYEELTTWVRSDYNKAMLPEVFESKTEALDWLPPGWHPDIFDRVEVEELNNILSDELFMVDE